jgi:hypothetical protein
MAHTETVLDSAARALIEAAQQADGR